ncbi:MbtH family protein [Streptomyces violaceusniger]
MSDLADVRWVVLINHEEQFGLHPADAQMPAGWREAGFDGTEGECIAYVDRHWTDMRPLSLRLTMDASAAERTTPGDRAANGGDSYGR